MVERVATTLPRNVDHEDLYSAGVLGLLGMVGEERLIAFEQFRALAVGTPKGAFIDGLRRDLGLMPGGIDAP